MSEINPQRFMNDLRHLRTIGEYGTGVVGPTFSTKDMEARQWLLDRMNKAGLKASLDGVGNVIGRSPSPDKGILIGSHTDTQPQGGWLDGKTRCRHATICNQEGGKLCHPPCQRHRAFYIGQSGTGGENCLQSQSGLVG